MQASSRPFRPRLYGVKGLWVSRVPGPRPTKRSKNTHGNCEPSSCRAQAKSDVRKPPRPSVNCVNCHCDQMTILSQNTLNRPFVGGACYC